MGTNGHKPPLKQKPLSFDHPKESKTRMGRCSITGTVDSPTFMQASMSMDPALIPTILPSSLRSIRRLTLRGKMLSLLSVEEPSFVVVEVSSNLLSVLVSVVPKLLEDFLMIVFTVLSLPCSDLRRLCNFGHCRVKVKSI